MKKIYIILILFYVITQISFAKDYDDSIDMDLRKQYKVEGLPALPSVSPSEYQTNHDAMDNDITNNVDIPIKSNNISKTYTIKGKTKVILISQNKLSNWDAQNRKVSFISQNDIQTKEGIIIPSGTLFKGTIINVHPPQITGNGGLIELKINEIYFNGVNSFLDTKLVEVNSKKIFANKIKGKRKYWQNYTKNMNIGKKTFKIMKKTSDRLLPYPIVNILSIVPFTLGSVIYVINMPIAATGAVFMKGSSVSIPQSTPFIIYIPGNCQIRG